MRTLEAGRPPRRSILGASVALCVLCLAACDPAPRAAPSIGGPAPTTRAAEDRIEPAARMSFARAVATSTRLRDGTVLVAGGCSDAGCELGSEGGHTAELFDPRTGTFRPVGDLAGFRDDHGAMLLDDGRVLIAGGWGESGVLSTTEIYDPASRSFSRGPAMASVRAGFTPIELVNGRVLLAGGFLDNDPTTAEAEIFDPEGDTIRRTGAMLRPRGAYAAALLPDGRVLVAGGLVDGEVVDSVEIYDPATGRFTRTGSMGTARYKAAAAALDDGTVIVIGGAGDIEGTDRFASTEIYDPVRGTFSRGPTMRWPRYKLAGSVVSLPDGSVVVAGGGPGVERLDPTGDRFETVPGDLGGERLFLTATRLGRDQAILIGGYDPAIVPTDQAWIFDPA